MTPNEFSPIVLAHAADARSDRSVALILLLLLGLVFAPVIGLHIAIIATGPETAAPELDITAHATTPPAKPGRG